MARIFVTAVVLVLLALPAPVVGAKGDQLAGYMFNSDVSEVAKLDLDQQEMKKAADAFQWSEAQTIYSAGKNSKKFQLSEAQDIYGPGANSKNTFRTLQGFSTKAGGEMAGEPFFELYQRYYNRPDYADRVISDALNSAAEFAGKPDVFRAQVASMSSQHQSVWMYVLHKLEDAINYCNARDLTDNAVGVRAWDEAWAFYTGSIVGSQGSNNGVMPYTLAVERCANFKTCEAGAAPVNSKILDLMFAGKSDVQNKRCGDAVVKKNEIARLMAVPLIQGLLRYVLQAKPKGKDQPKAHAKGLAFARSVLPWINHCDKGVAKKIVVNFQARANPPMKDSTKDVSKSIYKVLGCMGIPCDLVGEDTSLPTCETTGTVKKIPGEGIDAATNKAGDLFIKAVSGPDPVTDGFGNEPSSKRPSSGSAGISSNNSGGGLDTGGKIGVAIGSILVIGVLGFLLFKFCGKKKKAPEPNSSFEEGVPV